MRTTLPNASTTTEPARHTPERVLSTIAATSRLDGMQAPRRISFDESTPTTPLAVLSLTWLSLADMRPWLVFFGAGETHTYRRDDGTAHYTAYVDYHGWSLSLNALDSVRCTCGAERVHMLGCPAVAQCPATWCGGWCPGEVRHDDGRCDTHTSHNLTYDAPVTVSPEGVPEHLADHFAVLNPDAPIPCPVCDRPVLADQEIVAGHRPWTVVHAACDDPTTDTPYVPVPMPTGDAANRDECARLDGETAHHGLVDALAATLDLDHGLASILDAEDPPAPPVHLVGAERIVVCGRTDEGLTLDPEATTCVDCNRRAILDALATGPSRLSRFRLDAIYSAVRDGVVIAGDPDSDDPTTFQLPAAHCVPANVHPRGHEPTWQSGHPQRDPVRIVDVTTIPDLPTGNDAAISRTGRQPYASDQYTFAEAPDRLQTVRDDETFAGIVEASS